MGGGRATGAGRSPRSCPLRHAGTSCSLDWRASAQAGPGAADQQVRGALLAARRIPPSHKVKGRAWSADHTRTGGGGNAPPPAPQRPSAPPRMRGSADSCNQSPGQRQQQLAGNLTNTRAAAHPGRRPGRTAPAPVIGERGIGKSAALSERRRPPPRPPAKTVLGTRCARPRPRQGGERRSGRVGGRRTPTPEVSFSQMSQKSGELRLCLEY